MKIKQVCQITGLTERAVRYYIEEDIIHPNYTENYLGRRTFDFTDDDIEMLKDIAELRKFSFTVDEIRDMQINSQTISQKVTRLFKRKQETISSERELSERLEQYEYCEDISALAEFLASPVESKSLPDQDSRATREIILSMLKQMAIILITCLPIVMFALGFLFDVGDYVYPEFAPWALVCGLVSLIPSVTVFLLPKFKPNKIRLIRVICLILCIAMIPISYICGAEICFDYSKTEDISHYRALEPDCMANFDMTYQGLFPAWRPEGDASGEYYYYHKADNCLQYNDDIYLELTLNKAAFDSEVERVKALSPKYGAWKEVRKDNFVCLFDCGGPIFEEKFGGFYDYYIFAYDETACKVRYIHCANTIHKMEIKPYYLRLEW